MNITISDGVIASSIMSAAAAVAWAVRVVGARALAYYEAAEKRDAESFEMLKQALAEQSLAKKMTVLYRAITKIDSKIFTCADCGGWEGEDPIPKGLKRCTCSVPPPPATDKPEAK